eukprot:1714992-Rhodomonas_salina.1
MDSRDHSKIRGWHRIFRIRTRVGIHRRAAWYPGPGYTGTRNTGYPGAKTHLQNAKTGSTTTSTSTSSKRGNPRTRCYNGPRVGTYPGSLRQSEILPGCPGSLAPSF